MPKFTAFALLRWAGLREADGLLLSTQMHGYVLSDADFRPISPYVTWQDRLADSPAVTHEDRLMLQAMLSALGDEERQIVTLHALTGLRHREIAALLGLPLPTVLSKYSRALKKLQQAWKEED